VTRTQSPARISLEYEIIITENGGNGILRNYKRFHSLLQRILKRSAFTARGGYRKINQRWIKPRRRELLGERRQKW
jgi:hypothetical protein